MKTCDETVASLRERKERYAAEQQKKRKRLMQITAVLGSLFVVAAIGFGVRQAKRPGEEETVGVNPPVRFPERVNATSKTGPMSIEEASEKSTLIVRVRITNWEGDHSSWTTLYKADVLERYKGNCPRKILLYQDGTSEHVYGPYPLYAVGDELILMLKPSPDTENAYINVGGWQTILYPLEYEGKTLLISPWFWAFKDKQTGRVKDYGSPEVVTAFKEQNEVWRTEHQLSLLEEFYAVDLEEVIEKVWR